MGILAGVISGALMLLITTFFTPVGANALWWLNLTASAFYTSRHVAMHNGLVLAYDAPLIIFIQGAIFHFGVAAFCGLIVGKLTTSPVIWKMAVYGLVLGGLCWLASHMFGPDIFYYQQVEAIPEYVRICLFVPFGVLTGVFTAILDGNSKK